MFIQGGDISKEQNLATEYILKIEAWFFPISLKQTEK